MNQTIKTILIVCGLALAYYFISQQIKQKQSIDFLKGLGFGEGYLSQMRPDELEAVTMFIRDYTQRGKQVPEGSSLDARLLKIAGKYPGFINYK